MITRDFILAGNAIFTVTNATGQHYTFRVRRAPAKGLWPTAWFASVLTGPDNTSDYSTAGKLDPQTGDVRQTQSAKVAPETTAYRVLVWALHLIWTGAAPPAGYDIMHVGRCGRCGRPLTDPTSIRTGLGPTCRELTA